MMLNNTGYPVKSPAKKGALYTYSYSLTFDLEINNFGLFSVKRPVLYFQLHLCYSGLCRDLELVS